MTPPPFFLRDITCFTKIQMFLKLQEASSSKINFSKTFSHFSIWRCWLGILDIDTQLNSLELKWIQRLLNPTNTLWKGLMLSRPYLGFESNFLSFRALFWALEKSSRSRATSHFAYLSCLCI